MLSSIGGKICKYFQLQLDIEISLIDIIQSEH